MNKLIAITIIGVVAFATPVHADGPTIDIQATCDGGLTITTSGYPDGQLGMFSIGGEPPRQLVLNSVSHTDWPEYMTDRSYLIFTDPGDTPEVYSGDPGCVVVISDVSLAPVVEPVIKQPVTVPVPTTSKWENVALAPPW